MGGGGWSLVPLLLIACLLSYNKRHVNSKGKIGNTGGRLQKGGDLSARLVYMHTFTIKDKPKQKTICK